MVVWHYVFCYNEMKLAPFAVDYWKRYADKVIVYDNGSTDGVIEYLSQFPFIEIRHFNSDGLDDGIHMRMKNDVWKEARGHADFVVVSDFDEFVYADDLKKELASMKEKGVTIPTPIWYNMISDDFPVYDGAPMHTQCRGILTGTKHLIFDPNAISEINYKPGAHTCSPTGNVKYENTSNIFIYHAVDLGLKFILDKKHARAERMSRNNIMHGWGIHYMFDDGYVVKSYMTNLNNSVKL